MQTEKKSTGYPSIDKPWLKYYDEDLFKDDFPTSSIYDYVFENNKESLKATAIVFFGKKITYEGLYYKVEQCSKSLIKYGIKKGDIVSICMLMSPEVAIIVLALNQIGAICNFVAVNGTTEELRKQISFVDSKLIFVTDLFYSQVFGAVEHKYKKFIITVPIMNSASWIIKIITSIKGQKKHTESKLWESFIKEGKDESIPTVDIQADDIAVLEYTSGTTGVSKACMLTNRSINTVGYHDNRTKGLFDLEKGQSVLASIPPFLAFGLVTNMLMPLEVGLKLIMIPDPSPQSVAKSVIKEKPNHIVTGPTQVDEIIKLATAKKTNMSFVCSLCCGGDKLDASWVERTNNWLQVNGAKHKLINGYGMTETSATFAWQTDITDFMIPLRENNVLVTDCDTGQPLKYDEVGEICVSGPGIMKGYYKKEKETDEIFFEYDGITWMKTGDLGYVSDNGAFVVTGRLKRIFWGMGSDQIIYRIYPMAIEDVVSQCSMVDRCAVIGRRNGNLGYLPILYIVPMNGYKKDELIDDIKRLCNEKLKENSQPKEIIFIEKLPVTNAGKTDYKKLEEMDNPVDS